jgi:hypothetical protein
MAVSDFRNGLAEQEIFLKPTPIYIAPDANGCESRVASYAWQTMTTDKFLSG